jgi:hypothetical protein
LLELVYCWWSIRPGDNEFRLKSVLLPNHKVVSIDGVGARCPYWCSLDHSTSAWNCMSFVLRVSWWIK